MPLKIFLATGIGMCKTRETLEKLIEVFHDRSRMNPKQIAATLVDIDCPFQCRHIDYIFKLNYKKSDTSLGPDVLQLMFYLDDDSSWQTTVKDLDYTYDMLASDYGAIFGLLLGLSVIDTVVYFFGALKAFLQDAPMTGLGKRAYDLVKWFLITGLIGLLIILMFSTDFSKLILYEPNQHSETDDSVFLKTSTTYDLKVQNQSFRIKWGPEASGRETLNKSCLYRAEVGDGWCDEKANVPECLYDGNDCCKPGKEQMPNAHQFCNDCTCHKGDFVAKRRKPGLCEVCEFPFRSDRHYEREAEDCTPMVYDTVDDRTRYICSPAVYEINHVMIGIPYLWLCPKKEPHETQSTCFITNPIEQCETFVSPVRSMASSVQGDFDHAFAWDGQIDSRIEIYLDEHDYEIPPCDYEITIDSDFFDSSDFTGDFVSFVDYFCDDEDAYDYLAPLCEFESALQSGYFKSPRFTGHLESFVIEFCDIDFSYYEYDYEYDYEYYHEYDYDYYINEMDLYARDLFITEPETLPWLQLEFAEDVEVTQVWITTRFDSDLDRSPSNITISVGMKPMGSATGMEVSKNPVCANYNGFMPRGSNLTLPCLEPLTGTFLIVQQFNQDMPRQLAINEIFICAKGRAWWKRFK